MFRDRSLVLYFIMFFAGVLALAYQASGLGWLGDSVNFLCLLFLISGLWARSLRHIFENALLVSLGYMIPLLLRNLLKEKIPSGDFLLSAMTSFLMTCIFGLLFVSLGYALGFISKKVRASLRGRTTIK